MFYILIILSITSLLYMALRLRKLKKHDSVLFRICQVRRDTIAFLSDSLPTLTREEYIALRQLLYALNLTINNYQHHKCVLFNFRRLKRYTMEYHNFNNHMNKIHVPKDGPIRDLFDQAIYAFLYGFFTYTPLIRSELVLHLLRMFIKAIPLPQLGIRSITPNTVDTMVEINKQAQLYGVAI